MDNNRMEDQVAAGQEAQPEAAPPQPAAAAEQPPDSTPPTVPEAPAEEQPADPLAEDVTAAPELATAEAEVGDQPGMEPAAVPSPEETTGSGRVSDFGLTEDALMGALEAIIYAVEEPVAARTLALHLQVPLQRVDTLVKKRMAELNQADRGMVIREIAGGYKMSTKAEYHEHVSAFIRSQKPRPKLSAAALETLSVIAFRQPITAPEINEIRGVQGSGGLQTLLQHKLIATAGRKSVIGKPMLYKTTREFLVMFGLKDLSELPTLKEFEELKRLAFDEPLEPMAESPANAPGEAAAASAGTDPAGAEALAGLATAAEPETAPESSESAAVPLAGPDAEAGDGNG
jgi:segregation and condensation protein B